MEGASFREGSYQLLITNFQRFRIDSKLAWMLSEMSANGYYEHSRTMNGPKVWQTAHHAAGQECGNHFHE